MILRPLVQDPAPISTEPEVNSGSAGELAACDGLVSTELGVIPDTGNLSTNR